MAPERSNRLDVSSVRIPGTRLEGARAIAVFAIAVYVVLFIVLNNERVNVNFVFFSFRTNELLGLIVILVLGFAAGYIVRGRRLDRGTSDAGGQEQPDDRAITEPVTSTPGTGQTLEQGTEASNTPERSA